MIEFLNKEKEEKSKFLSIRSVLLLFLVAIFAEFLFFANHTGRISFEDLLASISPAELVELTNVRREDRDLTTLSVDPRLTAAAQLKADDMAEEGYFAHTSPDGTEPWHWFNEAGYDYQYAGENLAVNFSESHQVDQAWMDSPSHKRNIVNERFEDIGIATAEGEHEGVEATFVVQLFGKKSGESPLIFKMESNEEEIEEDEESIVLGEDFNEEGGEDESVEDSETEDDSLENNEEVDDLLEDEGIIEDSKEYEEESFALIEEREDGPEVTFMGAGDDFMISGHEEIEEYTSFWGRLSDRPVASLFGGVVAFLSLFSIARFKLKDEASAKLIAINQAVVILTVLLALLTKHYLLEFALYI